MSNLITRVERLENKSLDEDGYPKNITLSFLAANSGEEKEAYFLKPMDGGCAYARQPSEDESCFIDRACKEHRIKNNTAEHRVLLFAKYHEYQKEWDTQDEPINSEAILQEKGEE